MWFTNIRYFLFFLPICLIVACSTEGYEDVSDEIISIMDRQQGAWNAGDMESFMSDYWMSDSLVFIGSSGLNYGWQTTVDNYKKRYPNKEAMGRLEFDINHVWPVSKTHAYVVGKWSLYRSADTLEGHYTLLWKRINGQWKIIADHSS